MKYSSILTILIFLMLFCSCSDNTEIQKNSATTIPTLPQTPLPTQTPLLTPSPLPSVVPESTPKPREHSKPVKKTITKANTTIYDKNENRIINMKLASDAIDGMVLKKGEVFSFNDIVGERSSEKGYLPAAIIVKGKHVDGVGGGVCQVSTTLYHAALDCGLDIVERHRHDDNIVYAPNGTDCTVNYDNLDFKFLNNSDKDIIINVSVNSDTVNVKLSYNSYDL